MKLRISFLLLMIFHSGFISGCGNSGVHTLTPIQEAYQLMDKGNNAKAALILENEVANDPNNKKAKQLLGTAYVGLAGVDIYSIQAAFADVLFRQSLRDQVFTSGKGAGDAGGAIEAALKGGEKILHDLDNTFTTLQKLVVYLVRFPQVPAEKWPFLEKALDELNGIDTSADVPIYRILIHLIYMKSYLVENVIRDEDFGSRHWACTVDLSNLNQGLTFLHDQLEGTRLDLSLAVKLGARRLDKAQDMVNTLTSDSGIGESMSAIQESLTLQQGESRLRSLLGCEKI